MTIIISKTNYTDYKIYSISYFYSYPYWEWKEIFKNNPLPVDAYLIHFWGSASNTFTIDIDEKYLNQSDSLYATIAKRYLIDS